jgi:hypothetical protein
MANTARKIKSAKSNKVVEFAADESYIDFGFYRRYVYSTAITTGVTAAPAGSTAGLDEATTSNATGRGSIFKNIGGTWTAV